MALRGVRARAGADLLRRQPDLLEHPAARSSAPIPWEATTLEWATPTPPRAHGNFDEAPRVYAIRTSTACPGAPPTSCRSTRAAPGERRIAELRAMEIPYTTEVRPDTGLTNPKLGIWLFLASEVMLFGSLFSSYVLLRTGAASWPDQSAVLSVPLATLNTVILISSSVTMVLAWAALRTGTSAPIGCTWD
jgi:hypothetical protein